MTLLWIVFWALFVVISTIDLLLVSNQGGEISVGRALRWTGLWIGVALAFGVAVYFVHPGGAQTASLYLAGYLTEYSLSVDNLFVFILIFSLMGVPGYAQPKLIKLGILLSIVLRIVFIFFGIALVNRFSWLLYIFGALLVWTAWKMISSDEDAQVHPEHNLLYRLASRFLRVVPAGPGSTSLFGQLDGRWAVTSLFLVFLVIGSTDVLFAVDSIPAIMGISQDPFVVITSNVFAVLGLNSLFFAIRGIMSLFKFLKHGVSIILFFIGGKMIAGIHAPIEHWFKQNTYASLLVIVAVLAVSIALSVWHRRLSPEGDESAK